MSLPYLDLLFVLKETDRSSGLALTHWKAWKHRLGSRADGPDSYPSVSTSPYSYCYPTVAQLQTAFSFSDIACATIPDISGALLGGQRQHQGLDSGYLLSCQHYWAVASNRWVHSYLQANYSCLLQVHHLSRGSYWCRHRSISYYCHNQFPINKAM